MRTLNENKSQIHSKFLTELEHFKSLLRSTLVLKPSCFDGQFVTGEGRNFRHAFSSLIYELAIIYEMKMKITAVSLKLGQTRGHSRSLTDSYLE